MNLGPFSYLDLLGKKTLIVGRPAAGKTTLINNIKVALANKFSDATTITIDPNISISEKLFHQKLHLIRRLATEKLLYIIDNARILAFPSQPDCTLIMSVQYFSDDYSSDLDFDYIFTSKMIEFQLGAENILNNGNFISSQLEEYQFAIFKKNNDRYEICNIVETDF
jgi:predicted ATP-dependent endonuclease of OLD family